VIRVAIHQPNYMPWLGFFAKMAQCDVFVLLDDAKFSKNNIINRVKILGTGEPRWLTLPVSASSESAISSVTISQKDWRRRHLSLLRNTYASAPHFREFWPELQGWFEAAPEADLARVNGHFIAMIAGRLGLGARIVAAGTLGIEGKADDRLVAIVSSLAPGGVYVSGHGAVAYQDPRKFAAAGIALDYYRFRHPEYDQRQSPFRPGLSALDAVFHLGWQDTARTLAPV
jgi:hypothetical protein